MTTNSVNKKVPLTPNDEIESLLGNLLNAKKYVNRVLVKGVRLEEKLYSTFHRGQQSEQQRQPRIRKSPFEYLGAEFLYSGNNFGAETEYGTSIEPPIFTSYRC